ncbi:hypothetical protein BDR26DRAFT_343304 [Obelidium mucronatum]|nr:hypothetical protein BDR26DRAFT_343304 [Obelidium mucronatum]
MCGKARESKIHTHPTFFLHLQPELRDQSTSTTSFGIDVSTSTEDLIDSSSPVRKKPTTPTASNSGRFKTPSASASLHNSLNSTSTPQSSLFAPTQIIPSPVNEPTQLISNFEVNEDDNDGDSNGTAEEPVIFGGITKKVNFRNTIVVDGGGTTASVSSRPAPLDPTLLVHDDDEEAEEDEGAAKGKTKISEQMLYGGATMPMDIAMGDYDDDEYDGDNDMDNGGNDGFESKTATDPMLVAGPTDPTQLVSSMEVDPTQLFIPSEGDGDGERINKGVSATDATQMVQTLGVDPTLAFEHAMEDEEEHKEESHNNSNKNGNNVSMGVVNLNMETQAIGDFYNDDDEEEEDESGSQVDLMEEALGQEERVLAMPQAKTSAPSRIVISASHSSEATVDLQLSPPKPMVVKPIDVGGNSSDTTDAEENEDPAATPRAALGSGSNSGKSSGSGSSKSKPIAKPALSPDEFPVDEEDPDDSIVEATAPEFASSPMVVVQKQKKGKGKMSVAESPELLLTASKKGKSKLIVGTPSGTASHASVSEIALSQSGGGRSKRKAASSAESRMLAIRENELVPLASAPVSLDVKVVGSWKSGIIRILCCSTEFRETQTENSRCCCCGKGFCDTIRPGLKSQEAWKGGCCFGGIGIARYAVVISRR